MHPEDGAEGVGAVRTGKLVGGHKRVELLIESGETETDVWCIDLAPAKEKAALLALNTHSGEWDEEKLQAVLKDLEGSAFDAEFFDLAEALKNEPTKIEEIQILPAPRFAWVLIGVPIVQFSKVQAVLDKMPAEAIIKTTANDGPKEEQCSEENIPTE